MSREILTPAPKILVSKSFDGKHTIQFNEKSHRYKLDGEACVGTTTFEKAGYPTSMGLISWMKGQSLESLWNALTQPSEPKGKYFAVAPDSGYTEDDKESLFKEAKAADRKTTQEAADIGTLIHDYAYMTELGQIEEAERLYQQLTQLPDPVKTLVLNGVNKFKAWKKETPDELVKSEELVASPTHLFCGKFDRIGRRNGRLILGDFKSSKSIYLDHFIQLGAYRIAIREWLGLNIDALEVIRFGKDDGEFETLLIDDPKELQIFEDQAIRCRATYEFRKLENDPRWKWEPKS